MPSADYGPVWIWLRSRWRVPPRTSILPRDAGCRPLPRRPARPGDLATGRGREGTQWSGRSLRLFLLGHGPPPPGPRRRGAAMARQGGGADRPTYQREARRGRRLRALLAGAVNVATLASRGRGPDPWRGEGQEVSRRSARVFEVGYIRRRCGRRRPRTISPGLVTPMHAGNGRAFRSVTAGGAGFFSITAVYDWSGHAPGPMRIHPPEPPLRKGGKLRRTGPLPFPPLAKGGLRGGPSGRGLQRVQPGVKPL